MKLQSLNKNTEILPATSHEIVGEPRRRLVALPRKASESTLCFSFNFFPVECKLFN